MRKVLTRGSAGHPGNNVKSDGDSPTRHRISGAGEQYHPRVRELPARRPVIPDDLVGPIAERARRALTELSRRRRRNGDLLPRASTQYRIIGGGMHTSHRWFLTLTAALPLTTLRAQTPAPETKRPSVVALAVRTSLYHVQPTTDQQAKIKTIVAEQEPRLAVVRDSMRPWLAKL